MYELIKVTEHDYYIDCPAKIGVIRISDNEVVLIDSGSDKSAGKTVLKIVEQNNWKVKAILSTHSHADHIGGNRVIQERTGCSIYANGIETAFSNYPVLEPLSLYGSTPLTELRCKFLEAQASCVQDISSADIPKGINVIELPGHTSGMVGYLTSDGTFYIGDSLASEENLIKHPVSFLADVQQYLETLKMLEQFEAKMFVPSHAPVSSDLKSLVQKNIETVQSVSELIIDKLNTPKTFENLLGLILKHYEIPDSVMQYYLIGSTVKAYLNYLLEREKVEYYFADTVLLWKHNITYIR